MEVLSSSSSSSSVLLLEKKAITDVVHDVLIQICGGEDTAGKQNEENPWRQAILELKSSFVSLSNNSNISNDNNTHKKKQQQQQQQHAKTDVGNLDGKPHDIEIRAALTLFHRFQQLQQKIHNVSSSCQSTSKCQQHPQLSSRKKSSITVISSHGLERTFVSPLEFAKALCPLIEELCSSRAICYHVQCSLSGIICIVTPERGEALRKAGRLPCPQCTQWCKGEKGLWWHQQQKHRTEHSVATASAARERNGLAIIPYNYVLNHQRAHERTRLHTNATPSLAIDTMTQSEPEQKEPQANELFHLDPFDCVKRGDMDAVKKLVQGGYDPSCALDTKGASLLMWAAGGGHLYVVKYLIHECQCNPNQAQRGKRSFAGRTALHWAARNGHLTVVRYLVEECRVVLEASTSDGTTAFAWAAWQGHLEIMQFLQQRGADIHKKNSFGCNAVLWCAQGNNGDANTMCWLHEVGCDVFLANSNGHSVLHKAAQRGHREIVGWMVNCILTLLETTDGHVFCFERAVQLIGPDADGCTPSDLAGMEGYKALALHIATQECLILKEALAAVVSSGPNEDIDNNFPSWLSRKDAASSVFSEIEQVFEPWAGVRRMGCALGDLLAREKCQQRMSVRMF